jgi:hypothetical protein
MMESGAKIKKKTVSGCGRNDQENAREVEFHKSGGFLLPGCCGGANIFNKI